MFFLFELSNWCVNLAGLLILQRRGVSPKHMEKDDVLLVSRDLEWLLLFGQFARAYWGMSPPEIWLHDPTNVTKYVVLLDFSVSIVVWGLVVVSGFFVHHGTSKVRMPAYLRWPTLLIVSAILAIPGSWFVQPDPSESMTPFPLAEVATIFNFSVDVLALLPQLYTITNDEDDYCSVSTRDFVGLLGLARIFRLVFWSLNFMCNVMDGAPLMWLIPFIVPDAIHTLVMGQYIYLWVRKVKQDTRSLAPGADVEAEANCSLGTCSFFLVDLGRTLYRIARNLVRPVSVAGKTVKSAFSANATPRGGPTSFDQMPLQSPVQEQAFVI